MHDRTGKGGMRGGPGPPLALWEELSGWAGTIPLQWLKQGPLVLQLPLWGGGLWVSARLVTASGQGSRGPLSPPTALGSSLPFPLPGPCLVTARACVGKHDWLCLHSGAQRLFLCKFTVENSGKTEGQRQRGQGSCLRVGLCHDV